LPKKNGRVKMAATITYLSLCRYLLVFSERFKYLFLKTFRIWVTKSIDKPKGHTQPQKNLPKKIVARRITPKTIDGAAAKTSKLRKIAITDAV